MTAMCNTTCGGSDRPSTAVYEMKVTGGSDARGLILSVLGPNLARDGTFWAKSA